MTIEHLRGLARKQPFETFTIRLSDGRSFEVTHPDFVSLPPANISSTFMVWGKDGSFDILSLRQVTGVSSRGEPPKLPEPRRRSGDDEAT
jgi:hypothetical protein